MSEHIIKTFDDGSSLTVETLVKTLTISAVAATVSGWAWIRFGDWRAQRLVKKLYGPTE